MFILGIESSCDDTSVALIDSSEKGHFVIAEKTASQIDIHAKYGGVVPEIAGRMHAEKIVPLIEEVLKNNPKPEAIAVTSGPGLITGLLVGVTAAKTLSVAKNILLVPINHIDGHIHSVEISDEINHPQKPISFPALCLVVSGGHTELILMKSHSEYEVLGLTKDDAAGECFDKVAKLLGFPYPGGPEISKHALKGRIDAIKFPRPMVNENNFNFSFSGLKTSALYWLRDNEIDNNGISLNDFCASFEQAIVEVLVEKTIKAAGAYSPSSIILAGGVSANSKLRSLLQKSIIDRLPQTNFLIAKPKYCMDNAAMIAVTGYYQVKNKKVPAWNEFKVDPNWKIGPVKKD